MKQKLLEKLKGYLVISWFANILVFKSSADPVYLTKWEDFLSSPNYPDTYPANSSLTWITSVSPGNRVRIIISDLQTTCDTDYLEIRDGDSMTSPLIARYCGEVGYTELISSGTRVLIHFVSDGVIDKSKRGFQLQHIGDCQVDTNQTSGVITTPNYPNDYLNYMECLWTIQLHPAMQITLECDEIAVEYEKDCLFDFLEILAGPSPDSPVLGRYCGVLNYSLTFEREGNMSIRFESDPDKEFGGFHCAYNVFKDYSTTSTLGSTLRGNKQTQGRNIPDPSATLQMDARRTGKGPYSTSLELDTRDSSTTLQMDSPRTVKETYSAYIDQTHGQNTLEPSSTLQIDSLKRAKGTNSAYIDQTSKRQSTRSLSKSPHTDSLMIRTVKGTTDYGVSTVQGSFVAVEHPQKSSNFQEQSQVSSFSSLSPSMSPSHTAPSHPTSDSVTPPAFQFPWHLTPFLVIIFVVTVVLLTYYLRVPDIVHALILAIKEKHWEKRRQMNASKADNQSPNLTKGNFSTEGFKTSLFHSHQREVFYEEGLNYSFFEMEATKAIEFSVRLDDEENQSSGSEESVEISCELEEETFDKKYGHDTLSEMFDPSSNDILRKRNTEDLSTVDTQ